MHDANLLVALREKVRLPERLALDDLITEFADQLIQVIIAAAVSNGIVELARTERAHV